MDKERVPIYNAAEATHFQNVPNYQLCIRPVAMREKLIKIGAKVFSRGRYVTFQTAEVAVPRQMFAEILSLIARLQAPPAPA